MQAQRQGGQEKAMRPRSLGAGERPLKGPDSQVLPESLLGTLCLQILLMSK